MIATDILLPEKVPLPHTTAHWARVQLAFEKPIASDEELRQAIEVYNTPCRLPNLDLVRQTYGLEDFYEETLPSIIAWMKRLPDLVPEGGLPFLRQGIQQSLSLPRTLVASLMANLFLCTLEEELLECLALNVLNPVIFRRLFVQEKPQETAKLAMFIQYFRCVAKMEPPGQLVITRMVSTSLGGHEWLQSEKELLPLLVEADDATFENLHTVEDVSHADFASLGS